MTAPDMTPYVLTGASGGGKSTLLAALAALGYRHQQEVGRALVEEQLASSGTALPWVDAVAFRDLLFQRSLEVFDRHIIGSPEIVVFDRSFLEAIAYSHVIGADIPESMMEEANRRRFHDPVFVCPPWKEIFTQDHQRQHDFEFACRDYEANLETYRTHGYRLVELPRSSVSKRVAIVEREIAASLL